MNQENIKPAASEKASPHQDKRGSALSAQRFQMLEDIAQELTGDIVFPTCFDVLVNLRRALQDPNYTLNQIAGLINLDPLISTRILCLANSVAFNPNGVEAHDIKTAINRLGLTLVRSTVMAIAINQFRLSKHMESFEKTTRKLWEHSVYAASAANVVARRLTNLNTDDAMLAGLVHDLGAFYMIYRASQYEELRIRPDTVKHLVCQWHESIGHSLLLALGLPENIVEAVSDHDQPRELPTTPKNLRDVVYVANFLAGGLGASFNNTANAADGEPVAIPEPYLALSDEIQAKAKEMMSSFS